MAARRAGSLWRGITVALGCISAVWMIFVNGETIASYIKSFIAYDYDFFEFFFSHRLIAFSALFLGVSFFAIIIRDLWALKKPLLWITLALSVVCFISIAVDLFLGPLSISGGHIYMVLFNNISMMLLMVAYAIFSIVGINSKRYQPFAFYFGVFCSLLVLAYNVVNLLGCKSGPDFSEFVPYLTVFAANFFIFKCSLYER